MRKIPVWIDCDPGVDDAAALLVANRLEELEIIGISAVSGNSALPVTSVNALKICELMGADYPVYAGASKPFTRDYEVGESFHGPDGLGGAKLPEPRKKLEKVPAWDAMYEAAKACEGRLELITLGPLTDVAIALAKYPDFSDYVNRILLMGGSVTRGNCTPCAEFNIHADPEAAQAVFRSPIPKVMCGLEVTEEAYLNGEEIASVAWKNTEVCRFIREATPDLLRKNIEAGRGGWCVHDCCPVLYCARPQMFKGETAGVFVETQSELSRGKTACDLYSDKKFEVRNTFVVLEIDRPQFKEIMSTVIQSY